MKKIVIILSFVFSANAFAGFNNSFSQFDFSGFNHYLHQKFQDLHKEIDKLNTQRFDSTSSIQYFDDSTKSYIIKLNTTIAKDNITIKLTDDYITITGSESVNTSNTQSTNNFSQTISLPRDADVENISADKQKQILTISIPKLSQPRAKFQIVPIK